jgi:hypothetical protein
MSTLDGELAVEKHVVVAVGSLAADTVYGQWHMIEGSKVSVIVNRAVDIVVMVGEEQVLAVQKNWVLGRRELHVSMVEIVDGAEQ